MGDITVTVTGTPPTGSYASESKSAAQDGTITVLPGITTIQFLQGAEQTWQFQSPWIIISPAGPFTLESYDGAQVTILDDDPNNRETTSYNYSLVTTEGNFDPQLINKG